MECRLRPEIRPRHPPWRTVSRAGRCSKTHQPTVEVMIPKAAFCAHRRVDGTYRIRRSQIDCTRLGLPRERNGPPAQDEGRMPCSSGGIEQQRTFASPANNSFLRTMHRAPGGYGMFVGWSPARCCRIRRLCVCPANSCRLIAANDQSHAVEERMRSPPDKRREVTATNTTTNLTMLAR